MPASKPVGDAEDNRTFTDVVDPARNYHNGPATPIVRDSPEDLVAARAALEARRLDTINQLLSRRKQVQIDAGKEVEKITSQLHALGWKASRAPKTGKTDS